jgi:hypothetical protein
MWEGGQGLGFDWGWDEAGSIGEESSGRGWELCGGRCAVRYVSWTVERSKEMVASMPSGRCWR